MITVPVSVHGKRINAIIDTASEVTLISDKLYNSFQSPPSVLEEFTLRGAGREMEMKGYLIDLTSIDLDGLKFKEKLYVAPIEDEMLIGLDFMTTFQATVDMKGNTFCIQDRKIPFQTMTEDSNSAVSAVRIRTARRVTVPANSVLRLQCVAEQPLEDKAYYIQPDVKTMLACRVCFNGTQNPTMSFINLSDRKVTLFRNQRVGMAHEVDEILPEDHKGLDTDADFRTYNISKSEAAEVPDYLKDLFERSTSGLEEKQRLQLKRLLNEYADVFSSSEFDIGNFRAIEHAIDTGDARPIKQRFRRTPSCFVGEEEKHLEKMLKADVIEPSMSEWASSPVLVRKRDGSVRWCIDYRALNNVTRKDVFPLPLVEECIDTLSGNMWFSKLDATWGYWQIKVKDEDRCKTAFTTKYGLYHFKRMPFGLTNAPSTFSRVMSLVLRGLHWNIVLAFLDDVLVLGDDFEGHLDNLAQVFQRFREYGIKLKAKKCDLFQTEVEYLGRVVGRNGLELSKGSIETMRNWQPPRCTKDVERFCGFANYHRNFIKDFAELSVPLYALTGKNKFDWGQEQQDAFEKLKTALCSAPVLSIPTPEGKFILDTDASDFAIGAELLQIQDGEERCISYCSFSLTPEQRRYCTTRKELLAVIRFTRHFRHYLLGRHFNVRTDHSSLQWLMNFKNPNGQLARWLEELSQYWMEISHRPGGKHVNADALSRLSQDEDCLEYRHNVLPEQLPCGGCNYCTKKHQEWSRFIDSVDDAVPLAQPSPAIRTVTHGDNPSPWINGYSWQDIITAQKGDSELNILCAWLKTRETPTEEALMLSSQEVKHYWINKELFTLDDDGVLWRRDPQHLTKKVIVAPTSMRQEILALSHDLPSAGHQGQERTIGRCKARFYWYNMSRDIRNYVASCATCNRNKKPNRRARARFTSYHASAPMERVHLDFMGPFPATINNNTCILMIVDQFTKWVECIPLPNQTAEETARAAVNQFFSRFGIPLQIFTDRGTNFESNLFAELCKALKIHKARTTPFRPSANGQVERFNRTVMDAVRCFTSRSASKWDEYLPLLAGAIRSAVNRSTGFTPNMLMLGREVNTPVELVFPGPHPEESEDYEPYVASLVTEIQAAHKLAQSQLATSQARSKRDYDLKTFVRSYSVGDAVYVLDTATVKGVCSKLSPTWKGPALIVRKLTDYVYEIMLRKKLVTINHDRIKPCRGRDLPAWLQKQRQLRSQNNTRGQPLSLTTNESLYCVCRGPDVGELMIQCAECREWYHGSCVNVTKEQAKLIDVYLCPECFS